MSSETIVGVFETATEAEVVASQLRAAGIAASAIEVHKQTLAAAAQDIQGSPSNAAEGRSRFWTWLLGEDGYQLERTMYEATIARGGAVVTVVASAAEARNAYNIISENNPVDLDDRATPSEAKVSSGSVRQGSTVAPPAEFGALPSNPAAIARVDAAATMDREVVQLAEEKLTVGKHQVEQGTARIRRFVVERPVEEQIRLRSERLLVERRPVGGDGHVAADAFSERVVEVREMSEEPVVGKTARVYEEVVVGKEVSERVETVRDTVRREDVEVTHPGSKHGVAHQGVAEPSGSRETEPATAVPPRI